MGRTGSELRILSRSSTWVLLTVLSASATAAPPKDDATRQRLRLVPTVEVAETYSDNVSLAPSGREDWDLITEVTPGLSVHGQSARIKADADYRIQNLLYLHEPSRSTVNQQFKGAGTAELLQDHLFLDSDAVVTQVALDPSRDASYDTVNSVPREDVYSFRAGPRYQQNLGGYARFDAKYLYSIVHYGGSSVASDTVINLAQANLASGRRFTRLGWNLSYYDERVNRSSESSIGDAKHQVAVADVRYALTQHFSLLARAGDETHEFDTAQQGYQNGTYTAGGFQWRPNRHTSFDALYGDRYKSASLAWTPTSRTSLKLGWRDTAVGANVGQAWNASASLNTRRTRWAFSYFEEPGTVQQLVFDRQVFLYLDPLTGKVYPEPSADRVPLTSVDLFSLTDEMFIRKRGELSFGLHTGRTTGSVIVFDEQREYTDTGNTESSKGVRTAAKWKFAPRTSWLGNANWSRGSLRLSSSDYELWRVETGLQEKINLKTFALVTVSHTERTSGAGSGGYIENRISVRLHMQF